MAASKASAEEYKKEIQLVLDEERNKSSLLEKQLQHKELSPKKGDTENDRLCLEIEALVKKNFHLKEENEKFS